MTLFDTLIGVFAKNAGTGNRKPSMSSRPAITPFVFFWKTTVRPWKLIVSLDGQLHRAEPADIRATVDELLGVTSELVDGLNLLAEDRYEALYGLHGRLGDGIHGQLRSLGQMSLSRKACIGLEQLEPTALLQAGAKAVNLGRLKQMGLPVPDGFVCTVRACKNFLHSGQLAEQIRPLLRDVEIGRLQTDEAAARIRELILDTPLPPRYRHRSVPGL